MVLPCLASRIEERDNVSSLGVDPRQVWPLVQVAVMAGQREVIRIISAAMLSSNDVLYVKRRDEKILLQRSAVFAAPPSSRPNKIADGPARHAPAARASAPRALACRTERKSMAAT